MSWKEKGTEYLNDFLTIALPMLVVGALWQIEIADINLLMGWQYAYIFTTIVIENNWAVRDFWMLIILVAVIVLAVRCHRLARSKKEN